MALATAKSVQLINMDTGEARSCHNPWLNQGHTVEFSPDGKKLLVGSSGFDAVFEFDTESGEVVWEWFAWDQGFDRSKLGHYVVRSATRSRMLAAMGHEVLLINDPAKSNSAFLRGKSRPISTAPTTTRPVGSLSLCFIKAGAMSSTGTRVRPSK